MGFRGSGSGSVRYSEEREGGVLKIFLEGHSSSTPRNGAPIMQRKGRKKSNSPFHPASQNEGERKREKREKENALSTLLPCE